MSSDKSSGLLASVPFLSSENWDQWDTCIAGYARFTKIYKVFYTDKPANITDKDGAIINQDKLDDWDDMNMQALGLIILRIPTSMHYLVSKCKKASEAYDILKEHFSTPGPAGIFTDFKDAIHFQLSDNVDPTPAMTSLQSLFNKLDNLGLKLSESVKCMILLAALPKSWENLSASILANKTLDTIKLDAIVGIIREEYQRRHGNASGLASRISGVKRKPQNPNWSNQKKPKNDDNGKGKSPDSNQKKDDQPTAGGSAEGGDSEKKKKRKRGKKGKGEKSNETQVEVATLATTNALPTSSTPARIGPYTINDDGWFEEVEIINAGDLVGTLQS